MQSKLLFIFCYFKLLILFAQSPGNVSQNLQCWFKANEGLEINVENQVNKWKNFGQFSSIQLERNIYSQKNYPTFFKDVINFNPVIRFSSSQSALLQSANALLNMNPLANRSSLFVVFKSSQVYGSIESNVFYYTPNIVSTEASYTNLDYSFGFVNGSLAIKVDTIDYWRKFSLKKYADNKALIAMTQRDISSNPKSASSYSLCVNGRVDINEIHSSRSYSLNSFDYYNSTNFYGLTIGGISQNGIKTIQPYSLFDGDIAEIIIYDKVVGKLESEKIQSYLAIKYGITLNQTSPTNYYNSVNGIVWDANKFSYINYHIAGIAKDDNSALHQSKSKSINDFSLVTISEPSSLDNMDYLMWAENNKDFSTDSSDVPKEIESRINKLWEIQETGSVGTVTVEIEIPIKSYLNSNLRLIIDNDGSFNSGTQSIVKPFSINSNSVTFKNVDFDNFSARYFTLGFIKPIKKEVIVPEKKVIVYQLITPNNDQLNDDLFIENIDLIPKNSLSIFNHEGNLVYSKVDYKNYELNSATLLDGTYYYVLKSNEITLNGSILVKR